VELLDNEGLRNEMRVRGRERALKLFKKETMAEKLLSLYEGILKYEQI